MSNTKHTEMRNAQHRAGAQDYVRIGKILLPYVVVSLAAVAMVMFRWFAVDSEAFFVTGEPAQRPFYAVRDMNYDDSETVEKLRAEVADSVIGVLVRGDTHSEAGFDDLCEILLNRPLEDTLLPTELRELLNAMSLDRRELLIATVRSIHEDAALLTNLSSEDREEFFWQRISSMEPDPSAGNVIFQILCAMTDADQKVDPVLTERVRKLVVAEVGEVKRFFYAGDRIVDTGEIISPEIALLLKLQGYPEGSFPLSALIFSVAVACVTVFCLSKSINGGIVGDFTVAQKSAAALYGNPAYPFFLLILGWVFEVGGVCANFYGIGVFPVVALIYLTLPEASALSCAAATVLSASVVSAGCDVTAFALDAVAGCAGAILGTLLFKRNFSRSSVWLHSLLLGMSMLFVAEIVQTGLTHTFDIHAVTIMVLAVLMLSFVVLVLLPLLEMIFDIVSPLGLIELTQPTQPLLRKLQIEAPGTFNHCQMVGNLAEAAAESIGLNPLLLRAGASFHDIGKLRRPGLFVENQAGVNGHDELSPAMSAMIILSHVKDGVEIAEENRLPSQIKAFIAEHHGTGCLTYFYKKALQAGLNVEESQFCYPGPKPQSKETGVLMLADSTEAAARSESANLRGIHDLTRLVDSVVRSKIESGQLDDVQFTLRDITQIKSAMVKTLNSMYHTRNIKPLSGGAGEQNKEEKGKESTKANGSTTANTVQTPPTHEEKS